MIIDRDHRTSFEASRKDAPGFILPKNDIPALANNVPLPESLTRKQDAQLPEFSEIETVRHFTNLSGKNYSVDTGFYPLGSCTMKYNPKVNEDAAALKGFADLHPLQSDEDAAGILELQGKLLDALCEITGMYSGTLQPLAGAHGEYTGMQIFRAYFNSRGETERTRLLVPDSSHGTNPASAHLAGFEVVTIPSGKDGLIDPNALEPYLDGKLAGIMLTNPNTLGLFEKEIISTAEKVHSAGGLLYYDGANLNAIMGKVRPGDTGFDVMHLNLHKTFSTPHGGGGPGAGPVLVKQELEKFLPVPLITNRQGKWIRDWDRPDSIGKVAGWYGNISVLVRAYTYILSMGADGLTQASETAVLNANYVFSLLKDTYSAPYQGPCMHEFVLSLKTLKDNTGISATDIAKGLIEHGIHPPTVYFPLIVPECLMIEPTETETKETLDHFVTVMNELFITSQENPDKLHSCPDNSAVGRVDEVRAARNPVLSHMMIGERPEKNS